MGNFNLDEFYNLLSIALTPSKPDTQKSRDEFLNKIALFSDQINQSLAEENSVYMESTENTKNFEGIMKKITRIVESVNPHGLDFSSKKRLWFDFQIKNYFKRVNKSSHALSPIIDELDKLDKSFKLDLTTLNITFSALQNKLCKLEIYKEAIISVSDSVKNCDKIINADSDTILFKNKVKNWIDAHKENLMKSAIVTRQRILTITMGIDNITKIRETLKTSKTITIELFSVLVGLANEKYRQKIAFNYSTGVSSIDANATKEAYQKADHFLHERLDS